MKKLIALLLLVIAVGLFMFGNAIPQDEDHLDFRTLYKCDVEDANFGFPDIYTYKNMFYLPKSADKQYVHTEEFIYAKNSTSDGWMVLSQEGGSKSTYNLIASKLEEEETKCYQTEEFPEIFQQFRLSHGIIILVNDGKHYVKT